jgi:hypothetical protein
MIFRGDGFTILPFRSESNLPGAKHRAVKAICL